MPDEHGRSVHQGERALGELHVLVEGSQGVLDRGHVHAACQ